MLETGPLFQMMRHASASIGIAASLGLATAVPVSYASDSLMGRAVLPAATFVEGPTSGQQISSFSSRQSLIKAIDEIAFINTSFVNVS